MTPREWYATKATALTMTIFVVVVIAPTMILGVGWLTVLMVSLMFYIVVRLVWEGFSYDHRSDGDDT